MGYAMKTWSNPVNLNSNNLNRIELGIKNSHDALEIVSEEVSNLQTKQFDILKDLKALTKDAPNILTTLENLQEILNTNDMSDILNNADSFLTKTSQTLSSNELEQVYKNLKLNTFLKLTDIKINNSSIVNGSEVNITLPSVDTSLNINSVNAVTNKAITKAINDIKESLKHINIDVEVPTKLSQLEQDPSNLLITQEEKDLWNSYKDKFLLKEDYKESEDISEHNHDDLYAPIKHTHEEIISVIPIVPTNISAFTNDLNYATEEFVKANGGAISTISVNGVTQQITDKNVNIKIPTDLNELTNSPGYITSYVETDPTVPAWAKEPSKPLYDYSELLNRPTIPTDNNQLNNGAGYITSNTATSIASDLIETFRVNNIPTINNRLSSLEAADTTLSAVLNNKSDKTHTHTEYSLTSHNHNSSYSMLGHTHEEYKTYTDNAISNLINSAPSTMNTLKELADAITENQEVIDLLNDSIATKADKTHTHDYSSTYAAKSHTHDYSSTYAAKDHTHTYNYSAVYTGSSSSKASNTTLSTLRIGYTSNNLYIWNS